jgi:hypothetical protein
MKGEVRDRTLQERWRGDRRSDRVSVFYAGL